MSKVLVTGGAGYLGGRIVAFLAQQGFEVIAGTRQATQAQQPGFCLTDFEDPVGLAQTLSGFDAVVHLAGMNEVEAVKNPEAAFHTTAIYTLRCVQAAKQAQVKRFVYFSTVHVYGAPLVGELSEDSPTRAVHPYATTHRAAEDMVHAAHREGAFDAVIFRLSNGYGFAQRPAVDRWTLLVNDLCREVATQGQITLKSSGLQYRDFIPLSAVCRAVELALRAPRQPDPFFNLGSGQSMTVLAMARAIAERSQVVFQREPVLKIPAAGPGEQPQPFRLVVDRLQALGLHAESWDPTEIDEFLRRCQRWFGAKAQEAL